MISWKLHRLVRAEYAAASRERHRTRRQAATPLPECNVHRKIVSPLTLFIALRIFARAIKWIHDPDAVNGKPTLIIDSLLRKYDVFWALFAQMRDGCLVSKRITLPPHLLRRCRVIAFTDLK
jgi:hypothetical protein